MISLRIVIGLRDLKKESIVIKTLFKDKGENNAKQNKYFVNS
jgi:hypothetical protein